MTNLYGITNIRIKLFTVSDTECGLSNVNDFLEKHNGEIIDIQSHIVRDGYTKIVVIYK